MMMMGLFCCIDACMMMEIDERSLNYLFLGPPGSWKESKREGNGKREKKRLMLQLMRLYLDTN
jgi:hypothetical protein